MLLSSIEEYEGDTIIPLQLKASRLLSSIEEYEE